MWCDLPSRRIGVNEGQISTGQCAMLPSRRPMIWGSHQGQGGQHCRAGGQAGGSTAGGCSEVWESLKSFLLLWNFWLLLLTPFGSDLSHLIHTDWEVSVVKPVLCLCEGTQVPSQHPSAGARSPAGLVLAERVLTSPGQRMTKQGQYQLNDTLFQWLCPALLSLILCIIKCLRGIPMWPQDCHPNSNCALQQWFCCLFTLSYPPL